LYYWGDIDMYGFHMLDLLRSNFPDARSFLMDGATLAEHRVLCVREDNPRWGELSRLTAGEQPVYESLHGLRLEQERIRYTWVQDALRRLTV
jgi:hypothetical protein